MKYIIMDLEWNGATTRSGYFDEIIEIGAVALDDSMNIISEFQTLVSPKQTRKIRGRIKDLTHITNDDLKNADNTFAVHCIVGCIVKGENGEKRIVETVTERTASANGLTITGAGDTVDALRSLIIDTIREKKCGAIQTRVLQTEADISHFPLEWAEFLFEFTEFEAL